MTIQEKYANLRKRSAELARAQAQSQSQSEGDEKRLRALSALVDPALDELYDVLHEQIAIASGYTPDEKIVVRCYHAGAAGRESRSLLQILRDRSGLGIESCATDCSLLWVTLSETAKACCWIHRRVEDEDREESVELNFRHLVEMNAERCAAWQELLPKLAMKIVDGCKEYLEAMPDKFYGIPDEVAIDEHMFNHKKFDRSYELGDGMKALYGLLTKRQLEELSDEVNELVAYGHASIQHGNGMLVVNLARRSQTDILGVPYFDYRQFYKQYDGETPELQQVMNQICDNLIPFSLEEQMSKLRPQRILTYVFDERSTLDFATVATKLLEGRHRGDLFAAISRKYVLNIKITDAQTYEGMIHKRRDHYIDFHYDLYTYPLWPEELVEQREVEKLVREIKHDRVEAFAEKLAERIFEDIERLGLERVCRWESLWWYPPEEVYVLQDEALTGGYAVKLCQVTDGDYINRLGRKVFDLTDGVVNLDMTLGCYRVRLS